ncbi:Uncharacterised protein [Vibrio cholerae]|nr:Uncharacterised protein [Vibrio cholerae]
MCPPSSGKTGNKLNKLRNALNTASAAQKGESVTQYTPTSNKDNRKPKHGPMIEITTSCQRVLIFSSLRASPPRNGTR